MTELALGDPVAAERYLREGYGAFGAMGERRYRSSIATLLAEALYAQGRFDEARQMTDEAQALTLPDDLGPEVRERAIAAKLLAVRGHFAAALRLADEAEALVTPSYLLYQAVVQMAKAEVHRLAGTPRQAERCLRAALRIYEDRRAIALAEQAKTALTRLTAEPGREPA